MSSRAGFVIFCIFCTFFVSFLSGKKEKIKPSYADVHYLPHKSNVLDFWEAESSKPTPLVVYIHGGGFRNGSKDSINPGSIRSLLDSGISVAAIEYRLIGVAPLPTAHHDCRRAIQFLRSKAKKWNIDKTRIGGFGGSAGAQLVMYLGFHDDGADEDGDDTIARESTRLQAISINGGQATMDLDWWIKHIPGYDSHHREREESYGQISDKKHKAIVDEISVINHISKDDPPIIMFYRMNPEDSAEGKKPGWSIHHVMHGIKLKEKLASVGVEAHVIYPKNRAEMPSMEKFFIEKLR